VEGDALTDSVAVVETVVEAEAEGDAATLIDALTDSVAVVDAVVEAEAEGDAAALIVMGWANAKVLARFMQYPGGQERHAPSLVNKGPPEEYVPTGHALSVPLNCPALQK
jgi:hypothetical protein